MIIKKNHVISFNINNHYLAKTLSQFRHLHRVLPTALQANKQRATNCYNKNIINTNSIE